MDYDKYKRMAIDPDGAPVGLNYEKVRRALSKNLAAKGTEDILPVEIKGSVAKVTKITLGALCS